VIRVDPEIGKKYGRRTVISYVVTDRKGKRYLVKCECGEEKIMILALLKRGINTSCWPCERAAVKRAAIARKKKWIELVEK
jgi:hypothetical protein